MTGNTTQPKAAGLRFQPLKREDLVQRIATLLTDAIVTGKVRPGEHISEASTARELGVSRAPVREAARLLESSGLVVSKPNRGFFVRTMGAADLDAAYELRVCIEAEAAARLAQQGAAEAVGALEVQIDRMRRAADEDAPLKQVEEDLRFHRIICARSGNSRFLDIFDQLAWEVRLGVALIGHLYDDLHRVAETHVPVVEALASGDPDAARDALRYHVGVAREHVVARLRTLEGAGP